MNDRVASKELILRLDAEGGSLAIWSLHSEGCPDQFVVKRDETILAELLSQEDGEGIGFNEELGIMPTFEGALDLLGRYSWYRLSPLYLNPKFVGIILREVARLGSRDQAERWKQLLSRGAPKK